ncbi:MAG: hypothetical protein JWQ44_417 [Chthoniobacter sp.]|nr:hypothetical protein [Chthoniobacter sp.]
MNCFPRIFRVFRGGFCLLLFAIAFCIVCALIGKALPFPEIPIVSQKLLQMEERHDDYDTLFIGSSRIHYQVIPTLFDRLAAEQGFPTRSFNAGVAGMRPPEDGYFLDRILQKPPKNLRWVFIELASIRLNVGEEKKQTMRAQYWHDWPRLTMLWRRATTLKPVSKKKDTWKRAAKELAESMGEFLDHLELFVRHQTNFGRGTILTSRLLSKARPAKPRRLVGALGENFAGWIPTGRPEEMIPENRATYDQELAERRAQPAVRDLADPVSQQALETMIAKVERLGATAILVVPPTTNKRNFFPRPEREQRSIVLDFGELDRHPELFTHENRLDSDHVNTAGAHVFTRILVQRWVEELRARRHPEPHVPAPAAL